MNIEEKTTTAKAIIKAEAQVKTVNPIKPLNAKHIPAKRIPAKHISAKHIPAVHVLATFENLMEDFRNNFVETIAYPWNWVSLEPVISAFPPVVPIREAVHLFSAVARTETAVHT